MNKEELNKEIQKLEEKMLDPHFWSNKDEAQRIIKELQDLKDKRDGASKYDKGNAIFNIYAGAGGDDAEDFVRMLFEMYQSYAAGNNFSIEPLELSANNHNGYRSISFEVQGSHAYKRFHKESGVHRLVRKSPFNSKSKRQTSFALVEVLPIIQTEDFVLDESELEISFARSGGAGGQNVNKRETAVRIVHPKTGFSVFISEGRTQEANRRRALDIMRAKLYTKHTEDEEKRAQGLSISDKVNIEWGSQMRSYVLDPYTMVKDHKRGIETTQATAVLSGDLEVFVS